MRYTLWSTILLCASAFTVYACSYCSPDSRNSATLREDYNRASIVVLGKLHNARLDAQQRGKTDVDIRAVLKDSKANPAPKALTLERYVPVDPKNPLQFLLFADVIEKRIDPYRGVPYREPAFELYMQELARVHLLQPVERLQFYFQYLDSVVPEVAKDAFHEFAKANDAEVAEVAKKLDRQKIRRLLEDATTPRERIGLYAYLLGAARNPNDLEFLQKRLESELTSKGQEIAGILGGIIELDAETGWKQLEQILPNCSAPLNHRLAALNTIRFFQSVRDPKSQQHQIEKLYSKALVDADIADMLIEDLRRWQFWNLTSELQKSLALPSHQVPILQRAFIRYLISNPKADAKEVLARLRENKADLVNDVEEAMQFELPPKKKD